MARNPLMPLPDSCPTCGTKIRRGRERCLRCGSRMTLTPATPVPPEATPSVQRLLIVAAAGVGLLLIVLTVRVLGGPSTVRAEAARTGPAAPAGDRHVSGAPVTTVVEPVARPDDPASGSRAALVSYRNGDVGGAIRDLTGVVDANPEDADALNNLGQALVRANRAGEAITYFDRAIERSPSTWAYHFNRARAFSQLQAWSRAIADYRQAAALFPEDYATQFNLGRALEASGDLSAAIESYQKAVALAPGQPDFLLTLAGAQEAANRPAEAARSYNRYLELEPATPDADKIKERIARLAS